MPDPLPALVLGVDACSIETFIDGDHMTGFLCPHLETMGAAFVLAVGVIVFAGLATFQRRVLIPAVLAIGMAGLLGTLIPAMAARLTMQLAIAVGAVMLFLAWRALR